jgi:hypothetical protein
MWAFGKLACPGRHLGFGPDQAVTDGAVVGIWNWISTGVKREVREQPAWQEMYAQRNLETPLEADIKSSQPVGGRGLHKKTIRKPKNSIASETTCFCQLDPWAGLTPLETMR